MQEFLVGVDEAGRGPIAGPVTVAAVAFVKPFSVNVFDGVRDSKQLSEKKREYFFGLVQELKEAGYMRATVFSSTNKAIDRVGIVPSIRAALSKSLDALNVSPEKTHVLLDGSLKAPETYISQETVIKGDETHLPITLAGIVAKVSRDRLMHRLGEQYPEYEFERHKGYGTKKHYEMLKIHGLCDIHRETFIDLTK